MEKIPSFLQPIKKIFDDYHEQVNRIEKKHRAMSGNKVIHVHFKADGSDEYFGSKAAVFQAHTPEEIGVKYDTIANIVIDQAHPYENKAVVIKVGPLIRKVTNRKNPLK